MYLGRCCGQTNFTGQDKAKSNHVNHKSPFGLRGREGKWREIE